MRPLAGRRLWFAGIGGAGMSALALVSRAWGAEVSGWDRVRTPYLDALEGHRECCHNGFGMILRYCVAASREQFLTVLFIEPLILGERRLGLLDVGASLIKCQREPAECVGNPQC